MYIFATGRALADRPDLAQVCDGMFRDRATQFRDRLRWAVTVDPGTEQERDQYDLDDTLYVIVTRPDGQHAGSMRLRETTGAVMINEHFHHLLPGGRRFGARDIWESTRFCLAPDVLETRRTAARLMYGAATYAHAHGIRAIVAVFDARMVPIYRRIGWPPTVLGQDGASGADQVHAGIWHFDADRLARSARAANLDAAEEASLRQAVEPLKV